jgi:putative nucleotide binding protein
VQGIGEKFFNLLEVVVRDGITVKVGDRLYVGDDKRNEVKYIRGKIDYSVLTNYSKSEIETIVMKLINENEKRFVDFFNTAKPLTTRLHSLELLPGIGKTHMWQIINQRRKKPFESFKDLQDRVEMLPDPKKIIARRILIELEGKDRYKLFVGSGF